MLEEAPVWVSSGRWCLIFTFMSDMTSHNHWSNTLISPIGFSLITKEHDSFHGKKKKIMFKCLPFLKGSLERRIHLHKNLSISGTNLCAKVNNNTNIIVIIINNSMYLRERNLKTGLTQIWE